MINQVVARFSLYLCPANPLEVPISEYGLEGQGLTWDLETLYML